MNNFADRRVPAEVAKNAERYLKLRSLVDHSLSAGIEVNTEKLNGVDPKPGEECRIYMFHADIKHQKEFFGKTLDEVIDLLPV
jgi:hypothetical protein